MRRGAAVAALVLVLAGCTGPAGEPDAVPEPERVERVETCDDMVDIGAQLVRAYVRVVEELRLDTLTSDDAPPELLELEQVGRDIDAKVASLGCDLEALNVRINAEIEGLETDSAAGQLLLQLVREGVIGEVDPGDESPATTGAPVPDTTGR